MLFSPSDTEQNVYYLEKNAIFHRQIKSIFSGWIEKKAKLFVERKLKIIMRRRQTIMKKTCILPKTETQLTIFNFAIGDDVIHQLLVFLQTEGIYSIKIN